MLIFQMVMFVIQMVTTWGIQVVELLISVNVNNYFRAVCFEWFQNTLKATHFELHPKS